MATIKEVAKEAQVSPATVSRVLNQSTGVSDSLRERVMQAMEKLDYRPSLVARSLRMQRTNTIAVMVPQLDQPFFSKLTFAIQQALFTHDYHTLTCSTMEDITTELSTVEMLLGLRVDGVIAVPTSSQPDSINALVEAGTAVVLVDRDLPTIRPIDRVQSDNFTGGYIGMAYLLQLGHRRIGLIGGQMYINSFSNRIAGINAAIAEYGGGAVGYSVMTGHTAQFDIGYHAGKDLLKREDPPTALFALTDAAAVGAMHAAHEMGFDVPSDVSVMGFDNIPLATLIKPSLSTVGQPIEDIANYAAGLLIKRMNNKDAEPQTITVQTELLPRGSTAPPRT